MTRLGFVMGIASCVALVGCGDDDPVTLELKNVPMQSVAPRTLPNETAQTSHVTIDSLRIPIVDVGLGYEDELFGSEHSGYLYSCDGDCEVELVGPALQNLLSSGDNTGTLTTGRTYTSVMIGTCGSSNQYTAKLKASAVVDGVTYYTHTGAPYLTTNAADYGPIEIAFNGCRNYTILSKPITYDGSPVTVSLYIDLRDIAHVLGPSSTLYTSSTQGACSVGSTSPASEPYICLDYAGVAGTVGAAAPTVERYRLHDADMPDGAPQVIGFYFDGDGQPIGGYNRAYLNDITDQPYLLGRPNGFKKASLDDAGHLHFSDNGGGPAVSDHVASQGNFTVTDFPRPTGTATITTIEDTNGVSATVNYTVTRLAD